MKRRTVLFIAAGLAFSVLCADQLLKLLTVKSMALGDSITILGPIRLTYVHNTGAAFSIMTGKPMLLAVFSLAVLAGIAYYIFKLSQDETKIPFILAVLAGGAAGNLLDRLRQGYVVDYIDIGFWPVFNLADIAIVVSCFALVFFVWQKERVVRE